MSDNKGMRVALYSNIFNNLLEFFQIFPQTYLRHQYQDCITTKDKRFL